MLRAVLAVLALAAIVAGPASASTPHLVDYAVIHDRAGPHRGKVLVVAHAHLGRQMRAVEHVRVVITGPTGRRHVEQEHLRTTRHERAVDLLPVRVVLTRAEARRVLGRRPGGAEVHVRVVIRPREQAPGLRMQMGGDEVAHYQYYTAVDSTLRFPPGRAYFATPNRTGLPALLVDWTLSRPYRAYVSSVLLPGQPITGCTLAGAVQTFRVLRLPPTSPNTALPAPPESGYLMGDGSSLMHAQPAYDTRGRPCTSQLEFASSFSVLPNAAGRFPTRDAVYVRWSATTPTGQNTTGGASIPLAAQAECTRFEAVDQTC